MAVRSEQRQAPGMRPEPVSWSQPEEETTLKTSMTAAEAQRAPTPELYDALAESATVCAITAQTGRFSDHEAAACQGCPLVAPCGEVRLRATSAGCYAPTLVLPRAIPRTGLREAV